MEAVISRENEGDKMKEKKKKSSKSFSHEEIGLVVLWYISSEDNSQVSVVHLH